jgi:hypothetical protein
MTTFHLSLCPQECLDFVYPILRHAIDLIQDKRAEVAVTHSEMQGKVCSLIISNNEKCILL